ncbi:GumC family protein [Dysgonomonas macrotermitis]|uniref:Capsular exopolysaccharide family n=1 Tax=Dysgonomonas macrotermitis TaxID=1346286 RepID=A0A1M5FTZ2_9BACT|nr:polysaccharide biosynthesis tyrosine autokinase [Dysgonomonas macrotermitis]SHF94642.1 capsular exopolysaccharide family [Dysgonomonas macrotermitis]
MSTKKKSEFVNVGDVILKYSKHWKWFLGFILLCLFVAIAYIKTVDPTYYIVSNIKLRSNEEGSKIASSLVRSFGLGSIAGSENISDEAAVIASQTHMRDMIYELGLHTTYDLKKFPFDKSLYNTSPVILDVPRSVMDTLTMPIAFTVKVNEDKSVEVKAEADDEKIGETKLATLPGEIKTAYGNFLLKYSGKSIGESSYKLNVNLFGLDYAAEKYKERIIVSPTTDKSDIIYLSIKDVDRQRGRDILNKLVELYNEDAKLEKNEEAENTASFIKERIDLLAIELSALEKNLESFKRENNITDITVESKAFIEKYHDLQEKTTEANIQMDIASMLDKYVNDPKNKYELIPTNTGVLPGTLEAIRSYNSAVLERTRLLQNTKENNPVIISLNEQVDLLRKNVQISVSNAKRDLTIRKQDWSGLEGEMQSRMSEMPKQQREYIEIERQRQVKSDLYVFLLTKMEETQLTLASTTPKAKVIDGAYNIWKPIAPRKMMVLAIALLLGVLFPVVILYLIDVFKFKIASKEELTEATSVPVLGEICLDKNAGNIAIAEGISTSTAELFRLVRTNLQFLMKKDEKVVLVTSSISGEGKSFFTVNLALSYSLIKNKKVVLVGLDIRNPKLSEYLSINRKDGMTVYLASDDMKPEDIIIHRPDLHDNMYVIPAGPIPPNPAELLLNDRLDEMFDYLRANFDYIIVDTAPVGMVSDTFSLDRVSDATIYLFRANYTNKSHLKFAESIVEDNKLKNMSIVINGTTTKAAYGYGYGHQSDTGNKK